MIGVYRAWRKAEDNGILFKEATGKVLKGNTLVFLFEFCGSVAAVLYVYRC